MPTDAPGSVDGVSRLASGNSAFIFALLLAVLSLTLYSPAGQHPFVNYDDTAYVVENSHVPAGLSWPTIQWAFTSTEASNWHPLTWLSHALDCQLFGLNASGHHWMSVLIHVINVLLLFVLLRRATGDVSRSALVAALFAVHPLNVESVAWIAERKNVLSTLFLLLTLGAYGWYVQKADWKRYSLVAAFFAMGLMAKPMLVTLPFALLLIDYWPLQRFRFRASNSEDISVPWSRLALEKLPLLGLSGASAAITVIAQRASLAPTDRFPLSLRLENSVRSCGMYLAKTIWPTRLALYYPQQPGGFPAWQWLASGLLLVVISVLVVREASRRPYLLVGWCWFLGTLVPVLGVVQVGAQAMADRYAYVPLIGVFVAIVWSIRMPWSARAHVAVAAAVILALSAITWRQIGYWNTDYDLWSHTLAVTGENLVAEDKLGVALQKLGRQDEAITHFANAVRLNASDPLGNFSIGADLQWRGRLQDAIPYYRNALQNSSDLRLRADAYQNLGTDYAQLGDFSAARQQFLLALQANPALVTVFAGLGQLAGEPARSVSESVVEHPSGEGYLQLARLFEKSGLFPEARLAYVQALTINPGLGDAQRELNALPANSQKL